MKHRPGKYFAWVLALSIAPLPQLPPLTMVPIAFLILLQVRPNETESRQAWDWAESAVTFCATLTLFLALRFWVLRALRAGSSGPESSADILGGALRMPSLLWAIAGAFALGLDGLQLSVRHTKLANNLISAVVIFSLAVMLNSLAMRVIAKLPFRMAGLSKTMTRLVIFSGGLLLMLRYWGISITPVLAGLGVGGLAVALALQDTLANFFAGVHLLLEAPIQVGDFVRISAEEEGTVTDIGWRTTRITTGANSTIVVPNKNLSSASILNYSIPSEMVGVFVPIMVAHSADIVQVEEICLRAAADTEGVLKEPAPVFVADPGIQPTHLQYRLAFSVERQVGAGLIKTAVLKKVLTAFREHGVPLPEVPNKPK